MFGNNSAQKLFNQKQKEAIFAMTRSVNTTFILYGPPGSGKTCTIVETIRRLLEPPPRSFFNFFSSLPPTKKILICTPSNLAADAIAEAILDQNFVSESDIFRLMSSSRDAFGRNHKLESITRTTNIYSNESDEAVRQIYDIPPKTEIMAFKIIVCTLGSTPKLSKYLSPGHFSHIFVDEVCYQ
uniref:DNA2/NAM7 helicase helicase domain-containing protein n=1 Tax=Panagrolaimus superbus TaxID=310955 RepID=A0A914Y809_9BILA